MVVLTSVSHPLEWYVAAHMTHPCVNLGGLEILVALQPLEAKSEYCWNAQNIVPLPIVVLFEFIVAGIVGFGVRWPLDTT